jgi:hypothetical protein
MHGRQLVAWLGKAAPPGSRDPLTPARAAAGTTPTGSQAPPLHLHFHGMTAEQIAGEIR